MATIKSINPKNGEELASFTPQTKDEALGAVSLAHDTFQSWKDTPFSHRKEIIESFVEQLREDKEKYATLITSEMGKRYAESLSEIEFCAEIAQYYAENAEEFLADHEMPTEEGDAVLQYAPIGALVGVMPWNFPFYQVVRFAVPNLLAGNTIVVRHASIVQQCAHEIASLFTRAGLPEGAYNNLVIPHDFMKAILSHKKVRGVSLTGSEPAGRSVAALAGENLHPTVLELGGNDPFIVLGDADLEKAVEGGVKGRLVNTGQSCVASKRFIVVKELADAFTEGMKGAMSQLTLGDPMSEDTDLGPLSSFEAAEELEEKVTATVQAGATLLLGGKRADREGAYFEPTILTGVSSEMPSYDQELFGPVATIYVVENEEEAVALANDSSYGLGGSVYSRDTKRAQQVARQIDTGMVFINQPTNSQKDLPFGGTKNSGYGRELSKLGILEFVNKKLIYQA